MHATEIILTYFYRYFTLKTRGSHVSTEISDELRIKFHHQPHHLVPSLFLDPPELEEEHQKALSAPFYLLPQQKPMCKNWSKRTSLSTLLCASHSHNGKRREEPS